jgi:secreted PhoX family phosphatase
MGKGLGKALRSGTALAGGLFTALAMSGAAAAAERTVRTVEFTATPAPASPAEMTAPYTRSAAVVTWSDGRNESFPLSHHILYRSGDAFGGWTAGAIVDRAGRPIPRATVGQETAQGPFFAHAPDANSLIRLEGARAEGVAGTPLYLVTHFEYDTAAANIDPARPAVELYGQLPMAMNLATLAQDAATGALRPVRLANVDFSTVAGLWIPCAGSLTPWNTHLGSEEYEPDARSFQNRPLEAMNLYLGTPGKTAAEGGARPYAYGHPVEVTVHPDGTSRVVKHPGMGRLSLELAEIMPDRRTAYYGDDGRDVVRLMFVADRAGDLSAGTLYAAKWRQTGAAGGGQAELEWLRLGHGSDDEIQALIDHGIGFADIFEAAEPTAVKAAPERFPGFRPVLVYPGTGAKAALEYLRLKPGREQAAAFLETRRYAGYLGATTEFTKMEGQAHNRRDRKLYTVLSYVEQGMLEGGNQDRPQDDIRLGDAPAMACGAVYESALRGGVKDRDGAAIDSDWVAVTMNALITGAPKPRDQTVGAYDKCDTERVANPDNIKYSEVMRTLFVGEDSGNHLNNFIWAYNVDTAKLSRLFSAPLGAENTGLQVVEDAGGFAYLMANIQHPGAEEDLAKYPEALRLELRRSVDERGAVGYLGGLPALH